MVQSRFVQIHALTQYTATLLNRDDSGQAKRLPYGGVTRTRISSQCLKRHWRIDDGEYSLIQIAPDPVRTKELAERAIMRRALANLPPECNAPSEETHKSIVAVLNEGLYGKNGNDAKARQPLLFGEPEVAWLAQGVANALSSSDEAALEQIKAMFGKSQAANFSAFRQTSEMPAGIIGAMFGRMVTSDPEANIDSAVSVAHAITTHKEESEVDYFTAMEDLAGSEPGAGHIGDVEVNSGIYYVYVCVDVPTLVSNTTGCNIADWRDVDRAIASEAAGNLVGLIATVSPGAKKGSTAPFGYADGMVVEIGERQPRSLSSAFREPTAPLSHEAKNALSKAVAHCDQQYGDHEARRVMGFVDSNETLPSIVQWVDDSVKQGYAS